MTPEMKRKLKEDRERLGFETSSSEEEDAHEAAAQIDALNGEEDEIFWYNPLILNSFNLILYGRWVKP